MTIGYQDFLLPADKGLRVVELLKDAVPCQKRFFDSQLYFIREQMLELGVTIVSNTQIRDGASQESMAAAAPTLQHND